MTLNCIDGENLVLEYSFIGHDSQVLSDLSN